MRFDGLENGVLLARASADGFDALLTKDANLQYQQNLTDLPLAVVVLNTQSNDIDALRPLLPPLLPRWKRSRVGPLRTSAETGCQG